ncbi:hypothetical protein MTO96_026831 [Rhipicephalus appendiculatus]
MRSPTRANGDTDGGDHASAGRELRARHRERGGNRSQAHSRDKESSTNCLADDHRTFRVTVTGRVGSSAEGSSRGVEGKSTRGVGRGVWVRAGVRLLWPGERTRAPSYGGPAVPVRWRGADGRFRFPAPSPERRRMRRPAPASRGNPFFLRGRFCDGKS